MAKNICFSPHELRKLEKLVCGGGYGIEWKDIDEHLSAEGLLRGAPAPDYHAKEVA